MFPIRDTLRSKHFPIVNWLLIIANVLVFLYEVSLPSQALNRFIYQFAIIPENFPVRDPLAVLANPLLLLPLFTHMFLHGGWFHVLTNMWTLVIFGDNVEDRMGPLKYLAFYLLSGLAAGVAQVLVDPTGTVPALGASGAIAGVLGAYFLLYPGHKVLTLVPLIIVPWLIEIPAWIYLGFWFVSQLFSGLLSLPHGGVAGGVAWWAHIGGFAFGALFFRLFLTRPKPQADIVIEPWRLE